MIYTTKENDRLDTICYKYYKRCDCVPLVLSANGHLNSYGAILPSNVKINLIEIAPLTQKPTTVNLWD